MSYTFPHFDDIPYPELVNFTDVVDIVGPEYCDLTVGCHGCIFEVAKHICATNAPEYTFERRALLAYVKLHHPEYLL